MTYERDYVGPHFTLSFKIGDLSSQFGVTVSHGQSKQFEHFIGRVQADVRRSLPLSVAVVESDPLYDDYGSAATQIKIGDQPKLHMIKVKVSGFGWEKKKIAFLTLVIESELDDGIRYVSDVRPNGWLRVTLEDGLIHPLPYLLKVQMIHIRDGREYFIVREGRFEGQKASVRIGDAGKSYLLKKGGHRSPAVLTFIKSEQKLIISGIRSIYAVTSATNPIPSGTYPLEIPYEPHPGGAYYMHYSKYAKTWFRIGRSGDRFLHLGARSAGCITVKDQKKWTKIYEHLISNRLDSKTIGTVVVKP